MRRKHIISTETLISFLKIVRKKNKLADSTQTIKRSDFFKILIKLIEVFLPNFFKYLSEIINTNVQKNLKWIFNTVVSNQKTQTVQSYSFQHNFFLKQLLFKAEMTIDNNFSVCLINKTVYFVQIHSQYLIFFTNKFEFKKKVKIENLCKIKGKQKKMIKLIFPKSKIRIQFLSKRMKQYFTEDLLLGKDSESLKDISFLKTLFLNMISSDKMVLFDLIELCESKIRKTRSFFFPCVYDLVKSTHFYSYYSRETIICQKRAINNEIFQKNYRLFCEFQFFINQLNVLRKMRKILFFGIRKLHLLFTEEEIKVSLFNLSPTSFLSDIHIIDLLLMNMYVLAFNSRLKEIFQRKGSGIDQLPIMKMKLKCDNSLNLDLQSNDDKLRFSVTRYNLLSKQHLFLEVHNRSKSISILHPNNSIFTTLPINSILNLHDYQEDSLIVKVIIKGEKKTFTFGFEDGFLRYIFKTLVYNALIMGMKKEIFGTRMKLNVNIITWNVAGVNVPDDLGILFNSKVLGGTDILSFGAQECGIFKIQNWVRAVKLYVTHYGFIDVAIIEMFQMFLIVFVKKDLEPFIENIESHKKAMGVAKVVGNKGGLLIAFKLLGYQFVFVNCHFAPKPYKVLERNKNAKTLMKSVRIGEKQFEFDCSSDVLFWQGDLNYRVDFNFDETIKEIKQNNLKVLLMKDQLIKQRQINQVFYDFSEGEINFNPTYRRIKGTDEYSNKNNQSPSWCDRVMVRTDKPLDINFYNSIKEANDSDHLPVLGKYSIYLTIPMFEDVDKEVKFNSNVEGKLSFDNIVLVNYNFIELMSELNVEIGFPFKMKLEMYYFTIKKSIETKQVELKKETELNKIAFTSMVLPFPKQFFFNLPHARSLNIHFVLTLISKHKYEIGFAKYCLENIREMGMSLFSHNVDIDISFRTRKLGTLKLFVKYNF